LAILLVFSKLYLATSYGEIDKAQTKEDAELLRHHMSVANPRLH